MPTTSKTPAGTGASRDSFGGLSLTLSTPLATQAQFLITVYNVRLEAATLIVVLAFGGHGDV